ncbi:two-component system sensor histidine kinase NtrB [Natribacillus halophilus]|uniref:histidine kinase n=1 Tax=Natribacillus halophilus TaxID=549003 RepID=A0A1G8JQP7_9BACI|nr:HAMP domain-containing sensor histidine kinase [Natribacillus halophilus]SDI33516.1 Signal transduction histidine kinase [Natribacillus halophilus]
MDVSLPNQNEYESLAIFDDLVWQETDIRLIINKDGTILYKNKAAQQLLYGTANFCQTLNESGEYISFLKKMSKTGTHMESTIGHVINGGTKNVFYRGVYKQGCFYLSGSLQPVQDVEAPKKIETLTERLPHGYLRVDRNMNIVEKNRRFFTLAFPKLQEERDASRDFERLRLETGAGACIYKAVLEAFQTESFSERIEEDREAECSYRGMAIYMPVNQEVLGLLFDESTYLKYEQLLAYKQQMESVSHLAAGVAHELRNPLSVIRGFLQLSELTDSFHKYAQTIFGEVDRMNKILENFLSISRKKFEIHSQSPIEVIHSVEDIIRSECLLNNVHFEANITETDRPIPMNEMMIKQVILNLLRNSMEAYDPDTKHKVFSLTTRALAKEYEIVVADNGEGIPAEIMEKLGEPFNTTKEKGTGIGISLSKKIIEDHEGTFRVESEKNKGTTTLMTLPFEE